MRALPFSHRYWLPLGTRGPTVSLLVVILSLGLALTLLPLPYAAALVVGFGGLIVIAVRPVWTLVPLAFSIPWSFRELSVGPLTIGMTEGLVGLVLAAWLAQMMARRRVETIHPPLLLPLLLFLGAILLSLPGSQSLPLSLKEVIKWLEVLGIYLFLVNAVDEKMGRGLIAVILLAGISQALLGIYQFFWRVGPPGFLVAGRFIRAYGTFEQPNPYAGYLGLILPLALAIFLTRPRTRGLWTLSGVALALMGLALGVTLSRGAWLGVAAAAGVVILLGFRWGRFAPEVVATLGGAALAGLVLFLFLGGYQLLPSLLTQRLAGLGAYLALPDVRRATITNENFALLQRLAHWQAAWGMITDHPWLGVGIGNYAVAYPAYALPRWEEPLGHAHNYYLNVTAEAGLIGLGAYLFLFAACFWHGWRALKRSMALPSAASLLRTAVILGGLGVLTALSVHNIFDNLYVHGMYVHVAMILGMIHIMDPASRREGIAIPVLTGGCP